MKKVEITEYIDLDKLAAIMLDESEDCKANALPEFILNLSLKEGSKFHSDLAEQDPNFMAPSMPFDANQNPLETITAHYVGPNGVKITTNIG